MKVDPKFCMNSYLRYRAIVDHECCFSEKNKTWFFTDEPDRVPVNTAEELDAELRKNINEVLKKGKVALMLSSGMDSAILARYLPEGTQTYTLSCKANSGLDETQAAKKYADMNKLKHSVVDIYWDDFEKYTIPLMKQKGCPIHSIEVQIYKAALQAKADGIDILIFGETADIIYGGHSKLLARDWTLEEFWKRFSFVDPEKVLKHPMDIMDPILPYVKEDGMVDVFGFLNGFEYPVSLAFYNNACRLGEMGFFAPYSYTILGHPLDYSRIRNGEGKYVVRDLYQKLYPGQPIPEKTPLPRPMTEWLGDWKGPQHPEFSCNCIQDMTGDQKWYIYALEQFMDHVFDK